MGIGDRAYMRNQRLARDPISVTAWTVGILVGFFILTLVQESAHADFLDWMPLTENKPAVWQWLSYALLHGGFWHLLGNCLVLWWTGATVEKEQGPVIFLKVLVGGALIGALTWYLSGLGGSQNGALIGLSAGVYALMLVALLDKLEHQITLLLFFFLPVTLKVRWLLTALWLFALLGWAFSELPGRHDWLGWKAAWTDSLAHSAHLGGLVFGWLAWRYLNRTSQAPFYAQVQEPMSTNAPSPAIEPETEGFPSGSPPTPGQARAEMDKLLDKISSGGFGSLTADEKRRLEELSARLR